MKLVPREKLNDYIGKEIGCSDWFLVDQEQICLLYTSDAADE